MAESQLSNLLSDYTYSYREDQIAYEPLKERAESRLLLVRKNPEHGLPRFEDCKFSDLPKIVDENPKLKELLLVRNRSKVLAARFYAKRATGSRHEIVLTDRVGPREWRAFIRHSAKIKEGEVLTLENSDEQLEYVFPDKVRFKSEDVFSLLEKVGKVPLPPYIKREAIESDKERYQSVWAEGPALSAAAPTASLHFTNEVWEQMASRMKTADVYLHVGRGTFEPLREEKLSEAELHEENFEVAQLDWQSIQNSKGVFAIGTTACRVVESLSLLQDKKLLRYSETKFGIEGSTKIFIRPAYEFQKVKALLTNFHLPASSLLVLVNVFAESMSLTKEAYQFAIDKKYRLFSYGDASLWV